MSSRTNILGPRRRGGWIGVFLRALLVVTLWAPIAAGVGAAIWLADFAGRVPAAPDLALLQAPYASSVRTLDGWHLAGARATQPVPLHALPPHVVAAFLAAEDEDFFSHTAFDLRAITRAAVQNWRAGKTVQGGSTISQQVAKQFLNNQRTLERKLEELLLARRIEASYSKHQILDAYLRSVFLGHRASGITNAAWHYFGKDPRQLTIAEAATLAGVLPAPSAYNPFASLEAAKRERNRVLRRMYDTGMIDANTRTALADSALTVRDRDHDATAEIERMPLVAAAARRTMEDRFDGNTWAHGGVIAVVPHRPIHQARARRALRAGIEALDKRQGVAPRSKVVDKTRFDARAKTLVGDIQIGRVTRVESDRLEVKVGDDTVEITAKDAGWATPQDATRHFKRPAKFRAFEDAFTTNDVVLVRPGSEPTLEQWPRFQGTTVVSDSLTGYLRASIGAYDAEVSKFDRAYQGCRQPGSLFKPIMYAEALSRRISAATMLSDIPVKVDLGRGKVWRPRNADRDFRGYVTLADALASSRNIPAVNLLDHLGSDGVVARARRLGIQSTLDPTSSMSLGSSCVRPFEINRVYSAFQRKGLTVDVEPVAYFVRPDGLVDTDHLHFAAPDWSTSARLDRMATVVPRPPQGVSENVAFIMQDLLRRVVTRGTAHDLPDEWLVAGKTGTTNKFDAWFAGFDGQETIIVWIGSDTNDRPLGRGEHGATVALPVFQNYYSPIAKVALDGDTTWPSNPPTGVEYVAIDPSTGLRSPEGNYGLPYPFLKGTAPDEYSPTRGTKQAQDIDSLIYDF